VTVTVGLYHRHHWHSGNFSQLADVILDGSQVYFQPGGVFISAHEIEYICEE